MLVLPSLVTVEQALRWAATAIKVSGSDSALLDAEMLLSHIVAVPRALLLANRERRLTLRERRAYAALVERRVAHEPVAYLVGERAFYDVDLAVDQRVLIPRPETEHLVERAIAWGRTHPGRLLRIADIGTGSGAIALVLARHLPDARVWGVDASAEALEVARINVRRYDLAQRVTLVCGDLLEGLEGPFDIIAGNLPYIASAELPTLAAEVSVYEPQLALDGGAEGLDLVARLIRQAPTRLACPGLLLLEIDPRQAEAVRGAVGVALPDATVSTIQDYAGWERVICAERPACPRS